MSKKRSKKAKKLRKVMNGRVVYLGGGAPKREGEAKLATQSEVKNGGEQGVEKIAGYERLKEELKGEPREEAKGGELWRRHHRYSVVRCALAVVVMGVMLLGGFGLGRLVGGVLWHPDKNETTEIAEEGAGVRIGETELVEQSIEQAKNLKKARDAQVAKEKAEAEAAKNANAAVASGKKLVALTFDDGPSTATTGRLLDVLKEKQAKATFFVVGTMAQRSPDLVKREETEGHEVGSHTMGHVNLETLDAAATQSEMKAVNEVFQGILGHPVGLLRPPYGSLTQVTRDNVGMPMVLWTVDTLDWKYRDAASVRQRAVADCFDGAIILMHDIYGTTVDAVAGIIDDLRAQGYELLTVSELARAREVTMATGVAYGSFRP